MDADSWQKALNAQLPPTIRIMQCSAVDCDFHSRFSATGKVYCYRIHFGEVLPPLDYGLAFHCQNLPADDFLEALRIFVGTHHFKAFSANRNDGNDEGRDTERTIFAISHSFPHPDEVVVEIHGNGFLYKMVRFLIGTGVYLTKGKIERSTVEHWLADPPENEKAPWCAPPDGLSLTEVCY
jgi:tRNA pseudouridine38-40 synthase